jgi:hypothetical protein
VRSRIGWFASISIGIVFFYSLGVFVRGRYGIVVSVHNVSGQSLRDVSVNVEPSGKERYLGAISDRQSDRAFVQAQTESHIALRYTDASGTHIETVVGYIESGYCGKAEVSILPDHITSSENIDPVFCKGGWLDFM